MWAHIEKDENGLVVKTGRAEIRIAPNGDIVLKTDGLVKVSSERLEGATIIPFPSPKTKSRKDEN